MDGPAALLFDLDGCLVDSLPSIARCWRETFAAFSLPVPSDGEIRPLLGPPAAHIARAFAPEATEGTIEAIVADYRARSPLATDVDAVPGIHDALAVLHERGATLAVTTSKGVEVARALEALRPHAAGPLIGDREHDVRAAPAHGLCAIGVLWGYGGRSELERAGADVLVREPSELSGLLPYRM